MRAIIIDDKDAKALLDQLKLESFDETLVRWSQVYAEELEKISKPTIRAIVGDIHRRFHYRVTRWLQEQGATVT